MLIKPNRDDVHAARLVVLQMLDLEPSKDCSVISVNISGNSIDIPKIAYVALLEVMTQIAKNNSFEVVETMEILKTSQAAKELGVTRPFLVKLLKTGVIPFSLVGKHRRVKRSDLMEYKVEVNTKAVANQTVFIQKTFDHLKKRLDKSKMPNP